MNKYRIIALLMLGAISFALSGCRYRILLDEIQTSTTETPPSVAYAYDLLEETTEPPVDTPDEITLTEPDIAPPDTQDETPIEYVSLAYVEAAQDAFSPLTMEIENEDARRYGTEETTNPENYETPIGIEAQAGDRSENIVTIEQPADIDGDAVIGTEGGVVGLVANYSTILRQGVNSIYPCQLLNIYTETTADLVTVHRGSQLYQLMIDSGGLNVSSRLTADGLAVTADWVVRRNPDVIVKFVDDTILGSGITHTHDASNIVASMAARPDWGAIEAVRNNRIILFSEQILYLEATQLAVQLLIAHMMYPELFDGIDLSGTIAELMGEMDGIGIYFYRGV